MFFSNLSLSAFILCIFLSFLSLRVNLKSRLNVAYSLLNFSIALWYLLLTISFNSNTKDYLFLLFKYFSFVLFFFGSFSLHFFLILTKNDNKLIVPFIYVAPFALSIVQFFNGFFIKDFTSFGLGYMPFYNTDSVYFIIFSLYSVAYKIIYFITVFKWLKKTKINKEKKQSKTMLISLSACFLLTLFIIPIFLVNKTYIAFFSSFLMIIWDLALWFSIVKKNRDSFDISSVDEDIISKISDMLIIADNCGDVIKTNERVKEITGYSEEELKNMSIRDLIIGDENSTISRLFLKDFSGQFSSQNNEVEYKLKSGILLPVNISVFPLLDKFNDKTGFMIIGKDIIVSKQLQEEINERRIAEELFVESEERYKTLIDMLPESIIVHSERKIVFVNPNILKMLGYSSKEEVVGKDVFEFVDKDYFDLVNFRINEMEKNNQVTQNMEEKFIKSNGDRIEVEVSSTPIVYHGKPSILVVARDISEKKKMEEKIFLSTKLESLGILAGGIAHDFNNILTAIIGNISVAKLYLKGNEEALDALCDAENSGFRAKSLTTQLMTFSKGGEPVKKVLNLKKSIIDNTRFILRGSNTAANFNIDENLYNIEADEEQFNQVLNNIIINARQSMNESGSINIECKNVHINGDDRHIEEGKYVKITISDFGSGISEENINKIFDPYFTTKKNGNGLGLASSYSIIKKHGGYIDVVSKLNFGSTFTIYLPATNKSLECKEEKEREIKRVSNRKILVMDDENIITTLLEKVLTKYGYKVFVSSDGEEALKIYSENMKANNKIDLVILDLTIPGGMGGKETMKELLKIDKDVKSIISSGYSNESITEMIKKDGFIDFMIKPYKIEDLLDMIEKAIGR